jgi:hypothetical protein
VVSTERFSETLYTFLAQQTLLDDRWYLRGLTVDHLKRLANLYSRPGISLTAFIALTAASSSHQAADEKQERFLNLTTFCHAFLYLNRENVAGEKNEITLAQAVDLLHTLWKQEKLVWYLVLFTR